MTELKDRLETLNKKGKQLAEKLDIPKKKMRIKAIEQKTLAPDFWDDSTAAQHLMQQLNALKEDVDNAETIINSSRESIDTLVLLADDLKDEDIHQIENEANRLEHLLTKLELQTYFSLPYDKSGAIFSIHAGQGGTEANDWTAMLQRMYMRYFDLKEWKYDMVELSPGDEVGIKSVTFLVNGRFAFGHLKNEKGVHRLVRLSPFNSDNLRQTTFAGVEVLPLVDETIQVELKDEDIEFESFHSSGKGGQNVNKVSTAVRLKHKQTGIVVECQTQRTQEQNRKIATQLLKSKLWEIEEEKRQEELNQLKGTHKTHGWGNQIRNYVLHPYKLVKDTRTDVESTDPDAVLDGEIEPFIQAMIRR